MLALVVIEVSCGAQPGIRPAQTAQHLLGIDQVRLRRPAQGAQVLTWRFEPATGPRDSLADPVHLVSGAELQGVTPGQHVAFVAGQRVLSQGRFQASVPARYGSYHRDPLSRVLPNSGPPRRCPVAQACSRHTARTSGVKVSSDGGVTSSPRRVRSGLESHIKRCWAREKSKDMDGSRAERSFDALKW